MSFDAKAEMNAAKTEAEKIQDPKVRKAYIEKRTREIKDYADMLRKMSGFVNSKNKNGMR